VSFSARIRSITRPCLSGELGGQGGISVGQHRGRKITLVIEEQVEVSGLLLMDIFGRVFVRACLMNSARVHEELGCGRPLTTSRANGQANRSLERKRRAIQKAAGGCGGEGWGGGGFELHRHSRDMERDDCSVIQGLGRCCQNGR